MPKEKTGLLVSDSFREALGARQGARFVAGLFWHVRGTPRQLAIAEPRRDTPFLQTIWTTPAPCIDELIRRGLEEVELKLREGG